MTAEDSLLNLVGQYEQKQECTRTQYESEGKFAQAATKGHRALDTEIVALVPEPLIGR